MKLQVSEIKAQQGKPFSFICQVDPKDLGDMSAYPWSQHNLTIKGNVRYESQRYIVKGTVHTEGEYECSRCLSPFMYEQDIPFVEVYREFNSYDKLDESDEWPIDDELIDMTEMIRELLIMNEPYQVVCKEDCKGLCPHCGANLNEGSCQCADVHIDPRFADLRDWLKKEE